MFVLFVVCCFDFVMDNVSFVFNVLMVHVLLFVCMCVYVCVCVFQYYFRSMHYRFTAH